MALTQSVTLNSGEEMPLLGLGTWQSPKGQVYQAVYDAIEVGYRHIDCAHVYGNEEEVGDAISKAISDGLVKREELFITSKLWLTFYSRERVPICIERTLKRLKLDYLNLFLIHWPMGFKDDDDTYFPEGADGKWAQNLDVDFTNTWLGMEDVQKKGLTKSIGISNFNAAQVERILKVATIKPAVNQIELHPLNTQKDLLKALKEHGIVATAYCPLGSSPPPENAKSGLSADRPLLLQNDVVKKIADKYGKQPAQVLIRSHIQRGVVCIPKSVTKNRIEANTKVFDFELTDQELEALDALNESYRFCPFNIQGLETHRDYPFKA
jgi:aldehyde reductase